MATSEAVVKPQPNLAEVQTNNPPPESQSNDVSLVPSASQTRPPSCSSQASNSPASSDTKGQKVADIAVKPTPPVAAKLAPMPPVAPITAPQMFSFVLSPKNNKGDFPGIPISLPGYSSVMLQVTQLPGAKTSDQFYLNLATPSVITALNATPKNNKGQIVLSISSQSLVPKNNQPNCVPTTPTIINSNDAKKVRAIAPKPMASGQLAHSIDLSPNSKARSNKRTNSFGPNRAGLLNKGRVKRGQLMTAISNPAQMTLSHPSIVQNNQIALQSGSKIIANPTGLNGSLAPTFFSMPNGSTSLVFPTSQNSITTSSAGTAGATTQFVYDSATGTTRPILINPGQPSLMSNVSQPAPLCASIDPNSGIITYFANPANAMNGNRTAIPFSAAGTTTNPQGSIIFTQPGGGQPIFFPGAANGTNGFLQQSILPSGQIIQGQNIQTTSSVVASSASTNPIFINSSINVDTGSGNPSSDNQQDGEDILTLAWKLTQMDEPTENEAPNSKDVVNLDMMAEEATVTETVLNQDDFEKENEIIESVEKDQKEKSSIEDIGCLNSTMDIEKLLEQAARETVEENASKKTDLPREKSPPKSPAKSCEDQDFSFLNSFHGDDELVSLDKINTSLEKEPAEDGQVITIVSEEMTGKVIEINSRESIPEVKEEEVQKENARNYENLTTTEQIEDTLNFLNEHTETDQVKKSPKDTLVNHHHLPATENGMAEEETETKTPQEDALLDNQLDLDLESNLSFEPGGENSLFDLIFLPEDNEELQTENENLLATDVPNSRKDREKDDSDDSGSELDFLPQQQNQQKDKEIDNDSIFESTVAMLDENKNSLPHSEDEAKTFKSQPSPENNSLLLPPADGNSILEVIADPPEDVAADLLLDEIDNYEEEEVSPIKSKFTGLKSLDKMLKSCQKKSVDSSIANISISSSSTENNTTSELDSSNNTNGNSSDLKGESHIDPNESEDEDESNSVPRNRTLRSRPKRSARQANSARKRRPSSLKSPKGIKSPVPPEEPSALPEQETIPPPVTNVEEKINLNSTLNSGESRLFSATDLPLNSSLNDITDENRPKSFGLDLSNDSQKDLPKSRENSLASVANFSHLSKDQPLFLLDHKIQFQPPELNSDSDREEIDVVAVSTSNDEDTSRKQISGIKFSSAKNYETECCSSSSASPDEIFHSGCHVDLPIDSVCKIGESYNKLNASKFASRQDLPTFGKASMVCNDFGVLASCKEDSSKVVSFLQLTNQISNLAPDSLKGEGLSSDYLKGLILPNSSNGDKNIFSEMIRMVLENKDTSNPLEIFKKVSESLNNSSLMMEFNDIDKDFAPEAKPLYDNIPDSRTPSPRPTFVCHEKEMEPIQTLSVEEFHVDMNLEYSNLVVVETTTFVYDSTKDLSTKDLSNLVKYREPDPEPKGKHPGKRKLRKSQADKSSSEKKRKFSEPSDDAEVEQEPQEERRPSIKIHIAIPQQQQQPEPTDTVEEPRQVTPMSQEDKENDGNIEIRSQPSLREPIKLKLKLPFINTCKDQLAEKKKRREEKRLQKEARRNARKLKLLKEKTQPIVEPTVPEVEESIPSPVSVGEKFSIPDPKIEPIIEPVLNHKPIIPTKKSRGRPPKYPKKTQEPNVAKTPAIKSKSQLKQTPLPQPPGHNEPSGINSKRIFSTSREDRRSSAVFSAKSWKRPGAKKLTGRKLSANSQPFRSSRKAPASTSSDKPSSEEDDPDDIMSVDPIDEESKPLKLVIKFGNNKGGSTTDDSHQEPTAKRQKETNEPLKINIRRTPDMSSNLESVHSNLEEAVEQEPTHLDHLLMIADAAETFMDANQTQVKKEVNQAAISGGNSHHDSSSHSSSNHHGQGKASSLFPTDSSSSQNSLFGKTSSSESSLFPQTSNDYQGLNHDRNYTNFKNPPPSKAHQPNHMLPEDHHCQQPSPLKKRLLSSTTPTHHGNNTNANNNNLNASLDMSTGSSDTTLDIVDDTNTPPIQPTPAVTTTPNLQPMHYNNNQSAKKNHQALSLQDGDLSSQMGSTGLAGSNKEDNAFTAACQAVYQQQFAAAMASYYQSTQFNRNSNDYDPMSNSSDYPFPSDLHLHQQQHPQQHHQQQPSSHHPRGPSSSSRSSQAQSHQPQPHQQSQHTPHSSSRGYSTDSYRHTTPSSSSTSTGSLPPYINQFFDASSVAFGQKMPSNVMGPVGGSLATSSAGGGLNNPSDYSSSTAMQEYYSSAYTAVQQYAAAFNYYRKYSEWSESTGGSNGAGASRGSSKR